MPAINPYALEDIQIPDMPMFPMASGYPTAGAQGTDASKMIMAMIANRHAERAEKEPPTPPQTEQPADSDNSAAMLQGVAAGMSIIGIGVAAGLAGSGGSSDSDTQTAGAPDPAPSEPAPPPAQPEPQDKIPGSAG